MAMAIDMDQASNIGLVFSGGAALGAYEIGIWQVLKEMGLDKKITSVSGSSVGALNASLFAANLYEEALSIWSDIQCSDVVDGVALKLCKASRTAPQHLSAVDARPGETEEGTAQSLKEIESLEFTYGYQNVIRSPSQAVFSYGAERELNCGSAISGTSAIKSLIEKKVNPHFPALQNGLPFYLTRVRVDDAQLEYVTNQTQFTTEYTFTIRDSQNMVDNLLASSAAVPLYDCAEVDGVKYRDGGQVGGDNLPYTVLEQNQSPEKIIVSSLTPHDPLPPEGDDKYIVIKLDPKYYSTINLIRFHSDFARELMEEGVKDARRILGQ